MNKDEVEIVGIDRATTADGPTSDVVRNLNLKPYVSTQIRLTREACT